MFRLVLLRWLLETQRCATETSRWLLQGLGKNRFVFPINDDVFFDIWQRTFSGLAQPPRVMQHSHYAPVLQLKGNGINGDARFFFVSFFFFFFFFLQNTKTAFGFYQTFGQTLCSSEYNLAATCNIFERVKMCFGCCSILSRFFLAPAARRSFGGFIKLLGKIGLEGEVVTSYTRHALPIRKQTNRQTVSSTWTTRLCLPRYTCIHFNKVFSYLLDFTLPVSSHCWLCGNFCLPSRAPLPTIRKRGYEKCPV